MLIFDRFPPLPEELIKKLLHDYLPGVPGHDQTSLALKYSTPERALSRDEVRNIVWNYRLCRALAHREAPMDRLFDKNPAKTVHVLERLIQHYRLSPYQASLAYNHLMIELTSTTPRRVTLVNPERSIHAFPYPASSTGYLYVALSPNGKHINTVLHPEALSAKGGAPTTKKALAHKKQSHRPKMKIPFLKQPPPR